MCPRTCVRCYSTSSAYHSRSFFSRANRRIFNRLERSANSLRYLANFLRISNFDIRVNRASRFLLARNNPNPFISLRGSKELQGHPTRAKPLVNLLIRTAQKLKITKRPIQAAEHSAPQLPAVSANASGLSTVTWV